MSLLPQNKSEVAGKAALSLDAILRSMPADRRAHFALGYIQEAVRTRAFDTLDRVDIEAFHA